MKDPTSVCLQNSLGDSDRHRVEDSGWCLSMRHISGRNRKYFVILPLFQSLHQHQASFVTYGWEQHWRTKKVPTRIYKWDKDSCLMIRVQSRKQRGRKHNSCNSRDDLIWEDWKNKHKQHHDSNCRKLLPECRVLGTRSLGVGLCRSGTQRVEEGAYLAADGTSGGCRRGARELGLWPLRRGCVFLLLGKSKKLGLELTVAVRVRLWWGCGLGSRSLRWCPLPRFFPWWGRMHQTYLLSYTLQIWYMSWFWFLVLQIPFCL